MRSDTVTPEQDIPLPELIAVLRHYRLEKNFTYRKLGVLIGVGHSGLFDAMNKPNARVNDRTKYRIAKFVHSLGLLERRAS